MKMDKASRAQEPRPAAAQAPRPKRLTGLGVSPGTVIGTVFLLDKGLPPIPEHAIRREDVDGELARLTSAVDKAVGQLDALRGKVAQGGGSGQQEALALLDVHIQMLQGSRLVRRVEGLIREARLNAEAAVETAIGEMSAYFRTISDPYLSARIHDIADVGQRLIRILAGRTSHSLQEMPTGSILFTEDLTPAETVLLDPERVAGFATVAGGADSHTAIMARSLGIPAVLGVKGLIDGAKPGDRVVIDGAEGLVCLNPDREMLAEFKSHITLEQAEAEELQSLVMLPSITRDGVEIALKANIELPRETGLAKAAGAEGVGLLRSEFLFMNRDSLPSEDEQYESFREIVGSMGGRPVTIRTLDIGADKLPLGLTGREIDAGYNPALGMRAIRFSLRFRSLLEDQIAAILRVGAHGPVRILLPMITSAQEIMAVRRIVREVASKLLRQRVPFADPLPPLGAMIEVPGAALGADHLAQVSDFFSVGTNDLTMYTLAIDRANEQLADLYDPFNPAVLRLIQFTAQAAMRTGIPINICGEMAGDEVFTELFVGFGVRELSMSAQRLPRIKRRVRLLETAEAAHFVDRLMDERDPAIIGKLLRQRLEGRA
ncbi:MAG: phosphoenolpyruvate--protein phosphotransferase [Pseudomonadota bacterium]